MNSSWTVTARRYDTGRPVTVRFAEGKIAQIEPAAHSDDLPWIAPGLIDLQVNGAQGVEFNAPQLTVDQVHTACQTLLGWGVTSFLATCTTDSQERLEQSVRMLRRAMETDELVARCVVGIHLEGPAICPEDGPRGAHPSQHVRPPCLKELDQLQQASGNRVRLITLSPEYENAPEFIRGAVAQGIRIAIGHTNATTEQLAAAVAAGATLSTHLGNGAHPILKRHPNYIWDQLADERLSASLIVDGHHLPPSVVKAMAKVKGPEKIILVGDQTGLAGLPTGRYETSLGAVEMLPDGKLVVAGQTQILAGATAPLPVNIALLQRFTQWDLATAVDCASLNPARFLGLSTQGRLETGCRGDAVLFRPTAEQEEATLGWQIVQVIQCGQAMRA